MSWLIAISTAGVPNYWNALNGFTLDADEAVRFERKEDAVKVLVFLWARKEHGHDNRDIYAKEVDTTPDKVVSSEQTELALEPKVLVRVKTEAVIACHGPGIPHVKPIELISYGVFGTKISEVILPGGKVSLGLTRESANAMRKAGKKK
jgi:hypothetical protein